MPSANSENNENWWVSTLDFAARSDIGMCRTNNQDSHREVPAASPWLWTERGHLFILADGMGAHAAGELASKLAVETIAASYLKRTGESPYEAIKNSVLEAHHLIKRRGKEDDAFKNMGTTADSLLLLPEGAVVAHIGDSRTYRFRGGSFEQLTFDHSLVWELTRREKKNFKNIPDNIPKNIITRSLGPTANPSVDLEGPFPLQIGDTFLMCSDGLSGPVNDSELAQILALFPPKEAAESLINLTNLNGGPDNVTLIIAQVTGIPQLDDDRVFQSHVEKKPPLSVIGWSALILAILLIITGLVLLPFFKLGAIVPIFLGLASGGIFFLQLQHTPAAQPGKRPNQRRFGKGPYTQTSAAPQAEFAKKLLSIYQQLEQAAQSRSLSYDRRGCAERLEKIKQAFQQRDLAQAIRLAMKNINLMMKVFKSSGISSESQE